MNKSQQGNKSTRQQVGVYRSWQRLKFILPCSLFLVLILFSCSTNKEISRSRLKHYTANHIIREIEDNNFEFDNFEAKFDVKMKGDNKFGLKGQLRMQNDSLIWVSLSLKLGIEMARVMITEDSLKFINRSDKTYIAENLDYVNEILPVEASIKILQDILVGNNNHIERSDDYRVAIENNSYKLMSNENSVLRTDIWVMPKTFRISGYEIRLFDDDVNKIKLQYDNFQKINGKSLPTKISVKLNSGDDINLEIDYSEIKVGEKPSFPFNITKKYERRRL